MDQNLEPLYLSLPQFVSRAHGLSLASEDTFKFLRFVLAGRLNDGKERRVFLNTRQGIKPPTKEKYTVSRDIDSIIGVSTDLPYKSSLAIFPMPSFRDTLTEDIHKKYALKDGFPDALGAPLHKIPNFALGTLDRRHIVVICFPRMYKVGARPKIPPEDISLFYDSCLRPSFVSVSGHDTSRMHPTYAMLNNINHDKRGRLHFSTVDLKAGLLDNFVQELRQRLDKHNKFRDAFFVHQFRGLKGRYRHEPEDSDQRRDAMQIVFHDLQEDRLDPDQWMFDIALEIRDPGRILQWLTTGHNAILCHLLPSASEGKAEQLIKSQNYKCDITAQLEAIGGFRAVPYIRENPDKISYINIYTTDKSATYQYHEGLYRRRKAWHLFPGDIDKLAMDVKRIFDTFSRCRGEIEAFEGSARMEIRVPLNKVSEALKTIPHALISRTVLSFDCDTLWGFKYYRALALYRIITSLQQTAPEVRLQGASLTTGAIVIHMQNSLVYRPAEGKAENALLKSACYHDPEEIETQPGVYQPGAYFISDIQKAHPHQLPETCVLETEYLLRLYRRDNMADIAHEFRDKEDEEGRRMGRCRKKRKLTTSIVLVPEDPDESSDSASSASSGWNSDVEENGGNMMEGVVSLIVAPVVQHDETTLQEMSQIFQQFPSCIAQLVPDPRKGSDPWVLSNMAGTKHVTMDLFMGHQYINSNVAEQALIGRVFSRCQYKVVNSVEWETTIFERYFPPKGFSPPKQYQHFGRSQYHTMWTDLMKKANTRDATKLRKQAYLWFKELRWVPYPESDRIWYRKAAKGAGWRVLPAGALDGPRLAFNGMHWGGSAAGFGS